MTYTTVRTNRKQTAMKWMITLITLLIVMVLLGLNATANEKQSADIRTYTTVQVQEGDTLWEIASYINHEFYNGKVNIKDLIENIKVENDIRSVVIQPGEILKIATDLK